MMKEGQKIHEPVSERARIIAHRAIDRAAAGDVEQVHRTNIDLLREHMTHMDRDGKDRAAYARAQRTITHLEWAARTTAELEDIIIDRLTTRRRRS